MRALCFEKRRAEAFAELWDEWPGELIGAKLHGATELELVGRTSSTRCMNDDVTELLQALEREEWHCPRWLSQDPELSAFVEVTPSMIHTAFAKRGKAQRARLTCGGMALQLVPGYAAFDRFYDEIGVHRLPLKYAAKAMKECHTIARLVGYNLLQWQASSKKVTRWARDLTGLADALYHDCALGRK
eukprot:1480717-Amphidinium_carterae.1